MLRKFTIAAATVAAIATAGLTMTPDKAEARTVIHVGIGLPGVFGGYGGYYGGYYPAYYAPRYRYRCHRHVRRIRVWSPWRHRYVWRLVRGRRHCHRVRVW